MSDVIKNIIDEAMFTKLGNSWTYTLPDVMNERIAVAVALEAARVADECIKDEWFDVGNAIRQHFGVKDAEVEHTGD